MAPLATHKYSVHILFPPINSSEVHTIGIINFDLPSNCFFNEHDVFTGLSSLKNVKFLVGPVVISRIFFYNLRCYSSFRLWLLFRYSLDEITFPDL